MKVSDLQKKLVAVARENPPSDRVPHAFEKRITALLRSQPAWDVWAWWSRGLWRGAAGCLLLTVVLGAGAALFAHSEKTQGDLSQEFENTMLASAAQDNNYTW